MIVMVVVGDHDSHDDGPTVVVMITLVICSA